MFTKLSQLALVVAAILCVSVEGGYQDEEEYGKNFVPGTDQYKKDMCTGCRVAFKFINKEVAKYPEGATGEMRAAIILDSQPCKWAVGPTQSKCYRVIEELEAEIEEYIIEGKVDKAETDSLCFKYCEGIPEEEGEQQEL